MQPASKHLTLLVGLVAMLLLQPLLGHKTPMAGGFFDAVLTGICLYMFSIIFGERRQRRIALVLILPALGGNAGIYALPPGPTSRRRCCSTVPWWRFSDSRSP